MRILAGALAALLLLTPAVARADERILRYLSDVQVRKDSSIEVTETIDIRAENDRINHGIYRDFPTRYEGAHGTQIPRWLHIRKRDPRRRARQASIEPAGQRRPDQARRSQQLRLRG